MKKYLKTPEEVISVLKSGKTVYSDCGEYRMIDGLIVFKSKIEDLYTINENLLLQENLYIEESEPLKIEVGKFYETRGGEKARCYYADEKVAYFTIDGQCSFFSGYIAGNYFSDKEPSKYDIICPWEE